MAKKYKRNVSQSDVRKTPVAGEVTDSPVDRASTSAYSRRATEFNPDYTYVINDLKRIGVLAGSFFIILVVLSFILN
jgi:hypothetical protein